MAISQYGRAVRASWLTLLSLMAALAVIGGTTTLLSMLVVEARFPTGSLGYQLLPWIAGLPLAIASFVILRKYWAYLDLWCSCFECGNSNRVLFTYWEFGFWTILWPEDGRIYRSRPRPICHKCQSDLREMFVDDDSKSE